MLNFQNIFNSIQKISSVDGLTVANDPNILPIVLALKFCGLNVFSATWKPNVLTLIHCAVTATFWSIIASNLMLKIYSEEGLQFPYDIEFIYVSVGLTNALLHTYILINGRNTLKRVYRSVFVDFYSWYECDDEKLQMYRTKAFRMSRWVTYTAVQLYAAVFLMVLRPLTDGSDFPLIGKTIYVQGVNYAHPAVRTFVYGSELIVMATATTLLFTTDSVFIVLTTHLSAQLFLLGEELNSAGHSGDESRLRTALTLFVNRYNAVAECLEKISSVYRLQNLVLPLYTLVYSTLTLLAFDGSTSTAHCLALAVAHSFRLLNFCLPAEAVLKENDTLYLRLMWCGWETWPVRHRRSLMFTLQRLRRPLSVPCGLRGGFSLQQYSSTMKLIYSFYNTFTRVRRA